jgi:hypothetical protein
LRREKPSGNDDFARTVIALYQRITQPNAAPANRKASVEDDRALKVASGLAAIHGLIVKMSISAEI